MHTSQLTNLHKRLMSVSKKKLNIDSLRDCFMWQDNLSHSMAGKYEFKVNNQGFKTMSTIIVCMSLLLT